MRRRRSGRFMSPLSRSYRVRDHAEKLQVLFNTPDFCVTLVNDPVGVEFCGSLKNVIALGVGTPSIRENEYKRHFMSGVVRNYFENSYKEMVSFFAKDQKISTDDLKDIIDLIEKGKEK